MMVVVKIGLMLVEQRLHDFSRKKSEKALLVFKRPCFASRSVALHFGKYMSDGDKMLLRYCVHRGRIFFLLVSACVPCRPKTRGSDIYPTNALSHRRPATFQLKEGSGNIFQSLIDGQGKSLRDQLGLSSIEHIKSILFEVCPNLNNRVLDRKLARVQFFERFFEAAFAQQRARGLLQRHQVSSHLVFYPAQHKCLRIQQ